MASPLSRSVVALCLVALAGWLAAPAQAVLVTTSYSAFAEPNAIGPDANVSGGGTIDLWDVGFSTAGNASINGSFIGDSGNNGNASFDGGGAGTSAWALYANSGQTATATADLSGFTDPLVSLSIQFDNGFIDTGSKVGVRFLSGSTVASELSFTGGGIGDYEIADGTGNLDTDLSFTAGGFTLTLDFSDTTPGEYDVSFAGTRTGSFLDRLLAGGATDITAVEVYNQNAGGDGRFDLFFNNLTVAAVPEASPLLVMTALSGLGFVRFRRVGS